MVKTLVAGTMQTAEMLHLRELRLPKFDEDRRIHERKALTLRSIRKIWKLNNSEFLAMANLFEMQYKEEFFR